MIRRLYLFVVLGPWASLGSLIKLYDVAGPIQVLFCTMVTLWLLQHIVFVGAYELFALRTFIYKEIAEAHVRAAMEYIDERSVRYYVRVRYGVSRPKKWIPVYPGGVC